MIGSVLGAVILIMIPELMRFTSLSPSIIGPIQGLFYGAVLVAIMIFRPQGLLGKKSKSE
jgi:ABC-type branched-subunit amino acid transport system permease subunit